MKKGYLVGVAVITVLISLGIAGYGYAQTQAMANSFPAYQQEYGPGMMGRNGGRFGGMGGWQAGGYGPLHPYMVQAIANEFGISVEEIDDLHAQGKTLWEYAQEKGLTFEQFREKMFAARKAALTLAVEDGVITQQQADWMLQRMEYRFQNGVWAGSCPGGGRFGGRGPAWRINPPPGGAGS